MGTKIRKQIYIETEQEAVLKRMSEESGLSEAEIIRQAIDRHAQAQGYHQSRAQAWDQARQFIENLIELGPVPGGRTWKREDLYDRKVFR
jgi:hypothetical protein